jgi:hypothetical protein
MSAFGVDDTGDMFEGTRKKFQAACIDYLILQDIGSYAGEGRNCVQYTYTYVCWVQITQQSSRAAMVKVVFGVTEHRYS